jgi:hypothetical protein
VYFADAEERKELPHHRVVIVTMPHTRRAADTEKSINKLQSEDDVEFVTPVFRESQSGLRLVATDEITVRFKDGVSRKDIDKFNKTNGVTVIKENPYVKNHLTFNVMWTSLQRIYLVDATLISLLEELFFRLKYRR